MSLEPLRNEIDKVDKELVKLLERRFELVKEIGDYKKSHNLPVLDLAREQQVLQKKKEQLSNKDLWPHFEKLFQHIMNISKELEK